MRFRLLIAACFGALATGAAHAQVSDCPDDFESFAGTTQTVTCNCSAEAVKNADKTQLRHPVYGMDIYAAGSPICLSAIHAGVITRSGGTVSVVPEPGRPAYAGSTRNGVTSRNAREQKSSFRFAASGVSPSAGAVPPPSAPQKASPPASSGDCPDDFEAFAGTTQTLTCTCSAEAVKNADKVQLRHPVYGMDVYAAGSPVCLAAVHAGVIGRGGGMVSIIPEEGRAAYAGVTRNGIVSRNAREQKSSFRFAAAQRPAVTGGVPAQQPIAASIDSSGQAQLYLKFRFNSADLDESATPALEELRDTLKRTPDMRLMLVGHTDGVGTPEYNRDLSRRRAQSVRVWLIAQGIAADRLSVDGRGQEDPVADNESEEGRALNRRVQAQKMR